MTQFKEDRYKKQEVTIASIRNKYQLHIRRQQIHSLFRSIRHTAQPAPLAHSQLPIWPYHQQPQICHPIPQPIVLPQLRPEYLHFIRQYLARVGAGEALQQLLPVVAESATYNKGKQVRAIERAVSEDIYFEKENFRIFRRLIGEGSFSKVWEGVNLISNQKIAAKQIKKLQDHESKCLKSLTSPYIVKIHTILRHKDSSFIILEHCANNLREELIACDYNLPTVLKYFEQIIQGMHVLQSRNFIHRDLKFENILISNGNVKIADFGLAKHIGEEMEVQSRRCGTPYTMAPQIYFSRDHTAQYTAKCDIWSFGVILHEMLYQKHPFGFSSSDFRKRKRVHIKKKFGILDNLIEKCLVFNPGKRVEWNEVLNIYESYLKAKDRFMDIEVLPISAESVVYSAEKPVLMDGNRKIQQSRGRQEQNRLEQCDLKYLNDYNAREIHDQYCPKPLHKPISKKEQISSIQKQQNMILPLPSKDRICAPQSHNPPNILQSVNILYDNQPHQPILRRPSENKDLFANYRRHMERQNAGNHHPVKSRKGTNPTDPNPPSREVVRIYQTRKQEVINRKRIASEAITIFLFLVLVIVVCIVP